ncbi:MAG TPA: RNA chaperone Hfq [Xanthobacteraceae bacterium]|nr:RNA chaperone Hfq [Xanthobacteraceae bacterium]
MTADPPMRLQDTFLSHLQGEKAAVTVFLINGIKLQGTIAGFDNFCIALERDGQIQTVYKQAISTIMPTAAVSIMDDQLQSAPAAPAARRPAVVVERRPRRTFT